MKLRFLYFLASCLLLWYVLQSSRTGAAATFNLDRTGSPIAAGLNCGACHNGALNNAALAIVVRNTGGQIVTDYVPNDTYTVEFNTTNQFGFAHGVQGVALTPTNAQAGAFSSPIAGTKISPLNGRQYVEHSTPAFAAGGFTFSATWTAPGVGTGSVTFYGSGIVGNGNNGTSGDDPIAPVNLVLPERIAASIDYAQTTYCQNDFDPTPTQLGVPNGTYTASPSGLVINSSTGEIDLSASALGTYTITYTYSGGSTTDQVSLIVADDASYSYPSNSFCVNQPDPTPTITGLQGGYFLGSTGLFVDSTTGTIDISASGPGTYTVGYFTNGPCPAQGFTNITITNSTNASFSYSNASYCVNGADPTPTATTTGGTYTASPSGLSINASTGSIDLSASTSGNYTITYTTGGSCSNSSNQAVNILPLDNASFSYSNASYCQNGADPTPTVTGLSGGTFSSTAGLSINSSTGQIDVSASTIGSYTVTYTTNGQCPNISTQNVSIQTLDNASFSYSNASYCQNGADPTPTVTGLSGGTFSSTAGLSINSSTGQIDVSTSTIGSYTVTYTTNGQCPNISTQNVSIQTLDNASFSYSNASYCQNGADPTPTVTGLSGGTFSSTVGLSINASTGRIDVSASTIGNYTVTYTTNGTCPNSSTASVSINASDNAGFGYAQASYCQTDPDPTPNIVGLSGGIFSSTAGLAINTTTGQIDVSASTAGSYSVTYTTNGACPNTAVRFVVINATPSAAFSYSSASYCQNGSNPTPTITGASGGVFSSTAGLVINASTGNINLASSTSGTYVVRYALSSPCPSSSTQTVVINALDNAGFAYSANSYCQTGADPIPTVTGLSGGTFSSTAGLSINTITGIIDLNASSTGTYVITYTTTGPCPNSSTRNVAITSGSNTSFNYSAASYCQSATDPTPTITGTTGGSFSSSGGLSINTNTGQVDLSASTTGTYTITYSIGGNCPGSSTQTLTVTPVDNANFSYNQGAYCQTDADPTPTIGGLSGGIFGSSAGLSINTSTGQIDVSASTPGSYIVTYTTNGACPNSTTQTVVINAAGNTSFAYSAASYCQNVADPTPTITGNQGGTFSSTAGLAINATTGQVDVSASTAGAYTVTYTITGTCGSVSTQNLVINAVDNANFSYNQGAYCQTDADPTPTVGGLSGGVFGSSAGLSINTSTGQIDVSASTPGSYIVTYTTNGACPNSTTQTVVINAAGNTSFAYSAASYCQNVADPTPTITGNQGGTFSSTAGLAINATTGQVDVSASTAGAYTVTYTITGTCGSVSTQNLIINAVDNANFSYNQGAYCQTDADPTPTIGGLSGGIFGSSAGLSINTSTGQIDVSASTPGSYIVTYTTNGACPNSTTQTVVINAATNSSFAYASPSYCQNVADPTPTITGNQGGTFSSTAGLSINATTGQVDVSASTAGIYTITYAITGVCPSSSTQTLTVAVVDNANFNYSQGAYCQTDPDPVPTITGSTGGSFASTAGLLLNAATGQVDVSASTPGTYTVTYTTNGNCPNSSVQTVVINAAGNTTFAYSAASYCQSATDPTPTVSGNQGGIFSSSAGLSINASTGQIDVSASIVGTYTITYTVTGTCGSVSTRTLTINAVDNANFAYSAASYCQTDADPTPTITGSTGGSFSSSGGLSLNTTTGQIDVSASTPGTYTITYSTNGICPNSASRTVVINAAGNTNFVYSANSYCQSATDPTPTISGNQGGTFSSTAGLVINSSTGQVDLSASTAGTYTITYTVAGTCGSVSTQTLTINAVDNANFAYSAGNYCQTDPDPTPTVSGVSGGVFSSSAGLSLNTTTGQIDVSASNPSTYIVSYTTNGACPNSASRTVVINAAGNTSFAYSASSYCQSSTDPTPTISGNQGGTFSSSAGLVINVNTGQVDVSASTAGTYTITYTVTGACGSVSTQTVTINAVDNANFSYSQTSYCQTDADPTPTRSGSTSGLFSSLNGLAINAGTGQIDVSASTPGTYAVTYSTNGICPNSVTTTVIINAADNSSFAYTSNNFCQNAANPSPVITGLSGGTFTSTAGLVINGNTGQINLSTSAVGNYTVTYSTNGPCPTSSTQNIVINPSTNAGFAYSNTSYCQTGADPTPTITGNTGGAFSSTTGLVINAATGEIDLGASNAGTYTVIYAISGVCPSSSSQSITINTSGGTSFSYNNSSYCQSAADPVPTITGTTGGIFSSTLGLSINASTGQIDVSASALGTYTVTYTVGGTCGGSSNFSVTINSIDNANFSYNVATACQGGTNPIATLTGTQGGTFTASPAGLTLNPTTGEIDASASTLGTYTITYTTSGVCSNSSTQTIAVNALDNASFVYSATNVCTSGSDLVAAVSGAQGGTFTTVPSGLALNSGTGLIDVSASSAGTYVVTYTTNGTCPNSDSITINIAAPDNASFSYSASVYCQNVTDPAPTITGTTGGTFAASPAGLSINATTGGIDLSTSTVGAYTITYTTSGACPDSSTQSLTIISANSGAFSYNSSAYCQSNSTDPVPTITGAPGGVFASLVSGLVIDSITGEIDLSASALGSYVVTYTVSSGCPDVGFFVVNILAQGVVSFGYTDTTVCLNFGNPTIPLQSATAGTFSASPAGLVFANAATGEVDAAASTSGVYTVRYTTNGTCPTSRSVTVTADVCTGITQLEDAANYKLYPNPNTGQFLLEYKGTDRAVELTVLDALGKVVHYQEALLRTNTAERIDLSTIPSGAYSVRLQSEQGVSVIRMIVTKP